MFCTQKQMLKGLVLHDAINSIKKGIIFVFSLSIQNIQIYLYTYTFAYIKPKVYSFFHVQEGHSCFVEKYRMRAVQWENDFNTFLQTLVNISWFFYSPAMWGYVGGTWWSPSKYWGWLLVVLAQLVRFILKCC